MGKVGERVRGNKGMGTGEGSKGKRRGLKRKMGGVEGERGLRG